MASKALESGQALQIDIADVDPVQEEEARLPLKAALGDGEPAAEEEEVKNAAFNDAAFGADDSEEEEIATLEPYELFNTLQFPENLLVLDLRPRKEYHQSHVKGAVNLTIPDNLEDKKVTLEKCESTSLDRISKRFGAVVVAYSAKGASDTRFTRLFKKFLADPSNRKIKDFYILKTPYADFLRDYDMMVDEASDEDNMLLEDQVLSRGLSEPIYTIVQPEKHAKKSSTTHNCPPSLLGLSLEIDIDDSDEEETQKYPSEILPGRMWLGNQHHAGNKQVLSRLRITHIINCTRHLRNHFKRDFKYLRLDIQDDSKAQFIDRLEEVCKFIEDSYSKPEGKVLIHCQAGVSRSASMAMAYLIKTRKTSLKDAYALVQAQRRIVKPNDNFLNQLEQLERDTLGFSSRLTIGARLRKSPSTDLWSEEDMDEDEEKEE